MHKEVYRTRYGLSSQLACRTFQERHRAWPLPEMDHTDSLTDEGSGILNAGLKSLTQTCKVMVVINIPLMELVSLKDGVRAIASIEYAK